MNDLANVIEYLLLNSDHVVVPGLGIFMSQPVEARTESDNEVFLPPYRSVQFCQGIDDESETFENCLMSIFNIDRREANQLLLEWVSEFQQQLADNGVVELGSVGTFYMNDDNMKFTPSEAGVTSPEHYGLDAMHFPLLPVEDVPVIARRRIVATDGQDVTIRLSRRVIKYVSAAVVTIVMFMVYSVPANNTYITPIKEAKFFVPENLLMPESPKKVEVMKQVKPAAEMKVAKETVAQPKEKVTETTVETKAAKYTIVMASAVKKSNAEFFVSKLKKQGYETARILENGTMVRVVVGDFDNETDAYNAARDMRNDHESYQSVWILKL